MAFPQGGEVYQWPEFKALAKRLGIDWGLPTRRITLVLPHDAETLVIQEFLGRDAFATAPDTFTGHSKSF